MSRIRLEAMKSRGMAFKRLLDGKKLFMRPFKIEDLEIRGVKYLSIPMTCLYPAAKAMQAALKELKTAHDLEKIASMGVSWAEFNEIVGHTAWRRLELETLSDATLKEKYGTCDISEITRRETEAGKKWKGD